MENRKKNNKLPVINEVLFKSNPFDNPNESLVLKPSTVTIFVGPNNSGKSLSLREIHNHLCGSALQTKSIESLSMKYPSSLDTILRTLNMYEVEPNNDNERRRVAQGEMLLADIQVDKKGQNRGWINPDNVNSWLDRIGSEPGYERSLRSNVMQWLTLKLDAQTRLNPDNQEQKYESLQYISMTFYTGAIIT